MTENQTIFVAGATGAVGKVLVPLLRQAGYVVYGATRQASRAAALEALGATPVVVDVFDAPALATALARIRPAAVIHQLTDLPAGLPPAQMAQAGVRNARVRDEGTRNLVAAAVAAGCPRMVAQSIAWIYAPGPQPLDETCPLDLDATGSRATSVRGVVSLEHSVLATPGLRGAVLRYGQFYGPGTGVDAPPGASPVHIEAAAWAALLALRIDAAGVFNITDDNPVVSNAKARRELGWRPDWRVAPTA